jgi:hypothetical protein
MTIAYAMTAIVLIIGLTLMFVDVCIKLKDSEHRKISIVLISTTILVYITLPYIWFLFAKHFARSSVQDSREPHQIADCI